MTQTASNTPDPEDVILWPDNSWCYRYELPEFSHKSDDYEVVFVGSERYHEHQSFEGQS